MGLYRNALDKRESRSIATLEDYIKAVSMTGNEFLPRVQQTLAGNLVEALPYEFETYANRIYASHGPIFALMAVRMNAFSGIRFQWQRIQSGKPGRLFGTSELAALETPWPGGTTQDLLTKMITHADLSGNAYVWRSPEDGNLVVLRPDWVGIALRPRRINGAVVGYEKVGYVYQDGGPSGQSVPALLPLNEVAHFAPYPDPLATYRGMSWLTPVIRDIQNDKLMQKHQQKFFENGATPNMVITMSDSVSWEDFLKFQANVRQGHEGVENAYKTLVVGGGADATVVGANFDQMSFTGTMGRGETRLAAAAGVPVTIVGFSEGLQGSSLNAGNFAQARRRLADITMAYLWANAAGSLQTLLTTPGNGDPGTIRLWYDERSVPFLREDAKDVAEITQMNVAVLNSLVNSGWTPESAKAFIESGDYNDLQHSGLLSVQLQPPGTETEPTTPPVDEGADQ